MLPTAAALDQTPAAAGFGAAAGVSRAA